MKLIPILDRYCHAISENRIIKAIRRGLLYNVPLIMLGSFVVLALNLPIPAFNDGMTSLFGDHWRTVGLAIHKGTFRIISITTLLAISHSIVKNFDRTKVSNHSSIITMLAVLSCYIVFAPDDGTFLSDASAGPTGMFGAIVIAVIATELYLFINTHLPQQKKTSAFDADAVLQASLSNILPALLTVLCFAIARVLLDATGSMDLIARAQQGLNDTLFRGGENVLTLVLYCLTTHVLWFFGIHGTNVMEGVAQQLFVTSSDINIALAAAGEAATQVLTKEFLDVFVFMGGAGCTLGLLIALFIAGRMSKTTGIARYSVWPGLFNINEVMVYGLPIIFNPYYLVPFLLAPIALGLSSYIAFTAGWVPLTTHDVSWTTPIFISGYASTDSVAGVALQAFNLLLSTCIYLPFVRLHELQISRSNANTFKLITTEYSNAQPDNPPNMLSRNDEFGIITRSLVTEMRKQIAGESKGMYMAYQPKSHADGTVFGAEALLRWQHPVYGFVSPLVLVGIAEEAGLTVELGAWTLDTAFRQLHSWREMGYDLTLSVNLSPKQMKEDVHLASRVTQIMEWYNLNPQHMELELTEHAALDQSKTTKERLEQIRSLGVSFSIDDFGMGSSSLLYLRDFHASVVKLDISLVQTLDSNNYSQEIVRSIISLCRQINASVIAEGVETADQLAMLEKLGCLEYQGWYFSKALPNEDFVAYIQAHGVSDANRLAQ